VKNRLCIIIIIAFLNIMMVDGDKEGNNYVRSRVRLQGDCGQENVKFRGREGGVTCDWTGLEFLQK
jgi:hypothetical protein